MKRSILVSTLGLYFMMIASASADQSMLGSSCGLSDLYGDDSWQQVGQALSLRDATQDEVSALPSMIKQELVITAKNESYGSGVEIKSAWEAVEYLRGMSADGAVEVSDFYFEETRYTQVVYHPAGRAVGEIFKAGSRHIVAVIGDSDVICRNAS